jgi:protein phosphatase 1L
VTAILINNQKLWIANVGDSRAVLSRKGVAIQMSIDHEPNTERRIIENKGGFVSNLPGSSINLNVYEILLIYMFNAYLFIKITF